MTVAFLMCALLADPGATDVPIMEYDVVVDGKVHGTAFVRADVALGGRSPDLRVDVLIARGLFRELDVAPASSRAEVLARPLAEDAESTLTLRFGSVFLESGSGPALAATPAVCSRLRGSAFRLTNRRWPTGGGEGAPACDALRRPAAALAARPFEDAVVYCRAISVRPDFSGPLGLCDLKSSHRDHRANALDAHGVPFPPAR
jgi:hypothetical protein